MESSHSASESPSPAKKVKCVQYCDRNKVIIIIIIIVIIIIIIIIIIVIIITIIIIIIIIIKKERPTFGMKLNVLKYYEDFSLKYS